MSDFTMPSLGADMESGKLVEWLVKPGDTVSKGDIVAVVETHKGAIDVEIFEEATVSELCAGEGETVKVGGLLARLQTTGDASPPSAPPMPEATATEAESRAPKKSGPEAAAPRPAFQIERTGRKKVSPAAAGWRPNSASIQRA